MNRREGAAVAEVLFYHLTHGRIEQALPQLVERARERGWRVAVQTAGVERERALSDAFWSFRPDSFIAHGTASGGDEPDAQPVWLSSDDANPNAAPVRFVVDGASLPDPTPYERVVCMFDGLDQQAVGAAREDWKRFKADGHELTYWQQNEGGGWSKKA